MALFHFQHGVNPHGQHQHQNAVYYLNEERRIVPEHEAYRFVVKKKLIGGGWQEFFGFIKDPYSKDPGQLIPSELTEADENLYYEYGLDKELDLTIKGKEISFYIPQDFLEAAPLTFAGVTRTKQQIAKNAKAHQKTIYDYVKNNLDPSHVYTVAEYKCTSVALLYSYLNDGKKWRVGSEALGFVDGLFEIGGFISTSIDTTMFDLHTQTHETGHSVSYALNDQLFNEWFQIAKDKSEEPPTDYARTEISEDFAESYGFFFGPKNQQQHMKANCPKRWAYMERLKAQGNSAVFKSYKNPTMYLTNRFKKYDLVVW